MPPWPRQRSYRTHHVLWRLHGQTGTKSIYATAERAPSCATCRQTKGSLESELQAKLRLSKPLSQHHWSERAPKQHPTRLAWRYGRRHRTVEISHTCNHPVLPLWPRQGPDSTHQSLWRSHSQSGTNSWITPSFLKPEVTTNCSICWPIKGSCRAGVSPIKMRTWSRNHTAVPRTEAKRMGPLHHELEHRLPPKPQQRGTASSQPNRVPWRTMATAWTKPYKTLNAQQGRPHQLVGVEPTACSKPPTSYKFSIKSLPKIPIQIWWSPFGHSSHSSMRTAFSQAWKPQIPASPAIWGESSTIMDRLIQYPHIRYIHAYIYI